VTSTSRVVCVSLAALFVAAGGATSVLAGPIHSYDLTSSFADLLGGPSMVADGGTLVAGVGYVFGEGEGLHLSNALPDPASYSINMVFEFDRTDIWRKIVDTKNLTVDEQWYSLDGHLQFYPQPEGPDEAITPGAFVDVFVNRDGATGEIRGYVNGVLETDFIDTTGAGIFDQPDNIMRFFEDDFAYCNGCENSAGTVRSIEIFDGATAPVPEPDTALLLGAGALALAVLLRQR
jgi:hypothetical protein